MMIDQLYHDFNVITLISTFVSFLAISLLVLFHRHRSQFSGTNLPPGNVGYPVIGETFKFLSARKQGKPEKFVFERVKKYSSQVFKSSLIGEKTIFFCGPSGNKFIFANENKLVSTWFPKSVKKLFPSTPGVSSTEEMIKLRKIMTQFLKPEALQRYLVIIDQYTQSHFADYWENQNEVQVFPLSHKHTFKLATRLFINLETEEEVEKIKRPLHVVNEAFSTLPIDLPGTTYRKAIKASHEIRENLVKIIKKRKAELVERNETTAHDMLGLMLLTSDENGAYLTEPVIADHTLGLLMAGYHTLSIALTFIVKYLGELPHIYDAVYKEQMEISNSKSPGESLEWGDLQKMKYSWNVAQEVLRLAPPLDGAIREAMTDFHFDGFNIPKGWKLYWRVNSTHKSADYFPEPDKFDPSRFEGNGPAPYTYVPFGGGSRMCPGNSYARMVMLVFMHNLVKRFKKWEKLIPDEKIYYDPFYHPANGLPIRPVPHSTYMSNSTTK